MASDAARGGVALFGGYDGSYLGDTWLYRYGSMAPDEICGSAFDEDGDGLIDCDDPDCDYFPTCWACGDGLCDGKESCQSCPDDCGACSGCSSADIQLSEVYGGVPNYIEVTNTGSCVWDVSGLTLLYRMGCDNAVQAFTFPLGITIAPGEVQRAVEMFLGSMANEVSTGANICDDPAAEGWVMLCDGFCDLTACTNVLDYFERSATAMPFSPPACASFTLGPLDVTGSTNAQSATRTAFGGGGAAGLQSDWSVSPVSRD